MPFTACPLQVTVAGTGTVDEHLRARRQILAVTDRGIVAGQIGRSGRPFCTKSLTGGTVSVGWMVAAETFARCRPVKVRIVVPA